MAEYQYTTVPGKLEEFLSKVRETGVPSKATSKWLQSIGFKSSNDRTLVRVLRVIDFIDDSGEPTKLWQKYRGKHYRQILAQGIQQGYSELFGMYQNAHERSSEELGSFFSTRSTAGKQVISKTVSTFQTLCSLADFKSTSQIPPTTEVPPASEVAPKVIEEIREAQPLVSAQPSPALHIDIQIHISPDASPEQIDQIFASMAKHLYKSRE